MVAVTHAAPQAAVPQAVNAWLDTLTPVYTAADRSRFATAYETARDAFGDLRHAEGERLIDRALGTAGILAAQRLDPDSLTAALLVGLPNVPGYDDARVIAAFGVDVATLIGGVARMDVVHAAADANAGADSQQRSAQAENLRKMLLAMVDDIRVVLIKIAERTQALRFLMNGDERVRREAAREVMDIYAPLANRLGLWQLKWELEDLSLRALEPVEYKRIAKLIDERRLDRERYIREVLALLRGELAAVDLNAEVTGRPKHIFSIFNKMRRKQIGIDALYDIRAVRILVDSVRDCYTALGIVHHLWTPLPGEFDDYIAKPKSNNYRSLHTAVIGPEGKPLEVQIRTREMHRHSEYGVAAHWRYKEGAVERRDAGFDDKIAWLRQILDWKDAVAGTGEWLAAFRSSLFTDSIYVLTPQGKVVDLPVQRRVRGGGTVFHAAPFLVAPVGGHAEFGLRMHLERADLYFEGLAFRTDHRRMQRTVVVALGPGDVIVELVRHRRPQRMHHPKRGVARRDVVDEHAHSAQVVELADRHVLLLHLLPDAVDVLRPPGDFRAQRLRGQRIAERARDLRDVALAAAALVVEQARDALVGIRFEMAEREVLEFPFQLPDAEPVGERRVDVARELRQRDALFGGQLRSMAHARQLPRQEDRDDAQVADDRQQQPGQPFAAAGRAAFGVQRPNLRGRALAFEHDADGGELACEPWLQPLPQARHDMQDRGREHVALRLEH